ncbi:MAG: HU family DNA-binding protein [Minisyncoccia bacterium]
MTFDELFRVVAEKEGLTHSKAKSVIKTTFDEIKAAALKGSRVGMPQFGIFSSRATAGGLRPVGGVLKPIAAAKRVVFKASTGAKVSE